MPTHLQRVGYRETPLHLRAFPAGCIEQGSAARVCRQVKSAESLERVEERSAPGLAPGLSTLPRPNAAPAQRRPVRAAHDCQGGRVVQSFANRPALSWYVIREKCTQPQYNYGNHRIAPELERSD